MRNHYRYTTTARRIRTPLSSMRSSTSLLLSFLSILLLTNDRNTVVRAFQVGQVVPSVSSRQQQTTSSHWSRASPLQSSTNANEIFRLRPGSTVAIVTPMMEETGDIDYAGLETLLNMHLAAGTTNLCILGTTGEASVITMQERERILKLAVEKVKGRMGILAGVGTINPKSVREMTLQAIDIGCDAALVVTPYYVKPPQRALIKHMTDVADLGLPVIIYNVPGRTGVNFLDENIAIAAEHENVIGVKDATGDLSRVESMRQLVPDPNFLLFSGDDMTSREFVGLGGDGCISVTANVAPKQMSELVTAALMGETDHAESIDEKLVGLHKNLFLESNPIPTKWALQRMGKIASAYCRPPLTTFDADKFSLELEAALKQAELL